jgi:hypothetical protein
MGLGTYFNDTDKPKREGEPPHVESELATSTAMSGWPAERRKYVLPTNIAHYRFRIRIIFAFDFGIQAHRLILIYVGRADSQSEGKTCDILLLAHHAERLLTIMMTYSTLVQCEQCTANLDAESLTEPLGLVPLGERSQILRL